MKNEIGYLDLSKTGRPDESNVRETGMQRKVRAGALTFEGRIYVREALRNQVSSLFHANFDYSHFGALKTAQLVSRDIYWPGLDTRVQKDVAGCEVCHRINALRHI